MRLGLHLPQFRAGAALAGAELTEAAAAAEEAGADDLWVSDHLLLPAGSDSPPTDFHDPLTVLTWAAAATHRVGLGTSVLVAPYRHPVALAKTLASLDALSGGRAIAGLASGWSESEFAALGVPFRRRGALTDTAIAVCRALWAGREDVHIGPHDLRGMRLAPGPARPGGPAVWIGGNSPAGIGRAVRLGDGWHTTTSTPERLARRLEGLDAALVAAGRTRDDSDLTLSVRVRADAPAVALLAPALAGLGVHHVLVDPPRWTGVEAFAREAGSLRAALDAA